MIVYDKEQKQIVIPNGLGNVNIIINGGGECPECPELTEISITENGRYEGAYNVVNVDVPTEGGSCNLEDKWITPSMGDRDDNNLIVVEESEGYDGLSRVVIDPQTLYNEGVEEGRNQGGGGCNLDSLVKEISENGNYVFYPSYDGLDGYNMADIRINVPQEGGSGGGCTLTSRIITQNGTYRPNDAYYINMINFSQNGAFDSKLKVFEHTTIEFDFAFKDERPDLMSFYGCEDSDWQDSTFAARYNNSNIEVKIGSFVKNINVNEYTLTDGNAHKMKAGKNYGIEIDGQMVTTADEINSGITFTPSETRTIYIGAINSNGVEDNGLNLFWRPFNGFIGPVVIYGKNENSEEVTFNYETGDFGWWGEYKILQTGEILKNINTQEGATPIEIKWHYPNADGFSEVTVNMPLVDFNYTNNNEGTLYREASWDGAGGYSKINIDNRPYGELKKDEGKQIIKNGLKDLDATINSFGDSVFEAKMEDVAINCLKINQQRFLSNYQPKVEQNGFEIIIKAKLIDGEDGGGILIGTASHNDFEGNARSNIILRTNIDATKLWLGEGWTPNAPTRLNEWVTYRITTDGLYMSSETNPVEEHIGWEVEPNINNQVWDAKVAIGGLNTFYDGLSNDLRYSGRIAKVEFKQAETYTYVPTESGLLLQTETASELQTVDGGAAEYTIDTEKVGEYGWKKVSIRTAYRNAYDGLNLWYYNVTRIIDDNDTINYYWERALRGEDGDTIQNVFPARTRTINNEALTYFVAKPYFINKNSDINNNAIKIGKLVYNNTSYSTYGCGIVSIGAFDCKNIQEVDSQAFNYMTDLCYIDGMNGLGESFTSPQTIDFTYCANLFVKDNAPIFMHNFAESLYDFNTANKNGINTSTLKFNSAVQNYGGGNDTNTEAIALMQSKGWTVEFV